MTAIRRFWVEPPWHEDGAMADRAWRTVVAALGPACDEMWLRFGNLEDLKEFLSPDDYLRLEGFVGPYWGKPDPVPTKATDSLLAGAMQGIVDAFMEAGFQPAAPPAVPPKYAPYGCAVVPITPSLVDFLVNLRAMQAERTPEMLSRLSDHWHFRRGERDVVTTGVGMGSMVLSLTPEEVTFLSSRLVAAGLSPSLLVAMPES